MSWALNSFPAGLGGAAAIPICILAGDWDFVLLQITKEQNN